MGEHSLLKSPVKDSLFYIYVLKNTLNWKVSVGGGGGEMKNISYWANDML